MSLNFDYTSVPSKSNTSLGYVHGGDYQINITSIIPTNSSGNDPSSTITLFSFTSVPLGKYMFRLYGSLKTPYDSRYLSIYLTDSNGNGVYMTKTERSWNVFNTITPIPMNASCVVTNSSTQTYYVKIAANSEIPANTNNIFGGSIELVRIA